MYVAVVIRDGSVSGRPSGDWAGFVNEDKDLAVGKALKAREKWESSSNYGPYKVLVGELTEEVIAPKVQYATKKLSAKKAAARKKAGR